MKKVILFVAVLIAGMRQATACKLCAEQQPGFLRGVVHGPGPQGPWDYVIMVVSMIIVLVVLFYSIKYLVRPGEKNPTHIKYKILNENESWYGK